MTADETRSKAADHGLGKLTATQQEQFAVALRNGQRLAMQLPRDLHWSEEPAHVLRLTKRAEGGT